MPTIIDHGIERGISNTSDGDKLKLDPTHKKYVTYINELGAVHTIIVDVEHVAKTAEELLAWFLAGKGAAESGRYDNLTAEEFHSLTDTLHGQERSFGPQSGPVPTSQGGVG